MQSYIAIGLYKRVFNHAMDMLLETPYQAMTLSLVIDCLLHEGAYDEDLHELLKTHYASRKTDEKTCVALALMYFRAEEYKEETLEVLEQALGFADEESKNLIQTALVRCYEELSQGEKATEIYQTILQSLPDDIVLIRRLARNTVRGGDTRPESNGVLLKALKDGPYDTDLYFELCNIYINRRVKPITQFLIDRILANDPQQTHRLLKLFEKAVRLGMAGTSMNIQLAEYYYLEGQKERALRLLNQISQPTSRQARNMIEVYNIMLADDPTDLEVRRRRGELHCVLGETLQAVEDLTIFWENEGRKRPLPDDFVTLMKRYIAENTVPHPPILILVAKSLYRAGQYQEAIDLCHAILSLQRNHAEARFYLACSYYQVGNLDESARFMNRCENNRELMNWMYRLACDLERVGDEDGALEIFNQVIAELPTFRDCADRIYHIERGTSLQQSREIQDDINFPPELEGQPRKRFHLINELGRSPIFMIYKAFDHDTDEIVSLKVMSEQFNKNREAVELFLLEAQRFKKLNHPHILKVREIGEDAPSPYLISNYVSQGNVANLLKHDSVSMAQRIRWVLQLAEAMAHAHDRSHVHGNLNLRNILIDYFGLVKVTDFGLGRLNRESKVISRQLAVQVPIYQAPEIFMGEPVSMATDMYSFGICAYEMITLTPPFVGGDLENRHLHEPPAPMPDTPTILSEVVLQCLNKQARSRPNDMHQVVKALQQVSFDVSKRISITNF
jgi:tetratricopeptide (TPR) repeat protein